MRKIEMYFSKLQLIMFFTILFNACSLKEKPIHETFRIQEYEAYPPVEDTAKKLKTGAYNQFENPTGIWFQKGDQVKIVVAEIGGETIALRIHNFGKGGEDKTYTLREGENSITVETPGLGYVNYFTENWATCDPVEISIEGGLVNGYFDKNKHTAADWKILLAQSVCEVIDLKGDLVNLTYGVEALRTYCPENGGDLMVVYDEIINIQYDLLGFNKYQKVVQSQR